HPRPGSPSWGRVLGHIRVLRAVARPQLQRRNLMGSAITTGAGRDCGLIRGNDGLISDLDQRVAPWVGAVHLRGPLGAGSCGRAIWRVSVERPGRASCPDLFVALPSLEGS